MAYCNQFKMWKILTSTSAEKGLLYASARYAHTIGYINNTGQLFEVSEKLGRDVSIRLRGVSSQRNLKKRIPKNSEYVGTHKQPKKQLS